MVPYDEYTHGESEFADRITAGPGAQWPVEPGRYRLVVSLACPWATRAVIVRRLLGLEDAISLGVVDPVQDERSWRFTLDPDGRDPVLGIRYLAEAYEKRNPHFRNGVSVPAMVDVPSGQLVTNNFARITLDFATEWTAHHRPGAPDLYPLPCGRRSMRSWHGSTEVSTTRCTAPASPAANARTSRRTRGCSTAWTG